MKERKPNKIYSLVNLFSQCWASEYGGEAYEKSSRDFREAKEYLNYNDNDFVPDNITSQAKFFLNMNGIFAERRHRFCDFIRNIGTFAPPKKSTVKTPDTSKQYWERCRYCQDKFPNIILHYDNCSRNPANGFIAGTQRSGTMKGIGEILK